MDSNRPITISLRSAGVRQMMGGGLRSVVVLGSGMKRSAVTGSRITDQGMAQRGVLVVVLLSGLATGPALRLRAIWPPALCMQHQRPGGRAIGSCARVPVCCKPASAQLAVVTQRERELGPDLSLLPVASRPVLPASVIVSAPPRLSSPAHRRLFLWVRALLI